MKKLLGILVLGLLIIINIAVADAPSIDEIKVTEDGQYMILPSRGRFYINDPDLVRGFNNKKLWYFCCNYKKHKPKTLVPIYNFSIVNQMDGGGLPRLGNKLIRIEVRDGDCGISVGGYDDCKKKSERSGLGYEKSLKGEQWHAWSIYFPKDFIWTNEIYGLTQFHNAAEDGAGNKGPNWQINAYGTPTFNLKDEWMKGSRGEYQDDGLWLRNWVHYQLKATKGQHWTYEIFDKETGEAQWLDFVVHVKWTKNKKKDFLNFM